MCGADIHEADNRGVQACDARPDGEDAEMVRNFGRKPQRKWYAGVVCGRCGGHVPWVEDPSRGKVKLVSYPGAKISLT